MFIGKAVPSSAQQCLAKMDSVILIIVTNTYTIIKLRNAKQLWNKMKLHYQHDVMKTMEIKFDCMQQQDLIIVYSEL